MAWATPLYQVQEVNAAGKMLAKAEIPTVDEPYLTVINNWRSSHSYPLNTFQITLRNRAKKYEKDITVAQRIKRLESIHAKLSRQSTMRLSQMQDIAGCRVVFKSVNNVRKLANRYKTSSFDHIFRGEKDYISSPKADGYRCHHIVFEYRGLGPTSVYDGTKIEIQIRTQRQHAWATAVEAVGIFTKQALKSNRGDDDWLRFFAVMGTAIAAIEQTPSVPGTPVTKTDLVAEAKRLSDKLKVQQMLEMYNVSLNVTGAAKDEKYFLLQLDPTTRNVTVRRFKAKESQDANKQYTALENEAASNSALQVALVSVESIVALKRAYPNYFLDTDMFGKIVSQVLKGEFPDPLPINSSES
jgi:hypothetical protein